MGILYDESSDLGVAKFSDSFISKQSKVFFVPTNKQELMEGFDMVQPRNSGT